VIVDAINLSVRGLALAQSYEHVNFVATSLQGCPELGDVNRNSTDSD
jgi:hypothetical protein